MKSDLLILASMGLSLCVAASAPAAIVISDSFNDDGVTNGADPLDANWVRTNTGATRSYALDDAGGFGLGSKVLINRSNNASHFDRYLTGVGDTATPALAITESVRLSFDFRVSAYNGNGSNGAFRVGMYNANGTTATDGGTQISNDYGYFALFSINGSTANTYTDDINLAKETGTNGSIMFGTDRDFASTTGAGDTFAFTGTQTKGRISGNGIYSVVLEVVKTGASTATINTTLSQGSTLISSASVLDTNTATLGSLTFNEFVFLNNNQDNTFVFDNIVLQTVIPEPASLALLALGGLAMVSRRRSN